ncbi:MAG: hypothetical protein H0V18_14650 [Pyrinomonadaceae bacterium]|nr:hypothetical protein [Pyrinomonadaceae bacterium]
MPIPITGDNFLQRERAGVVTAFSAGYLLQIVIDYALLANPVQMTFSLGGVGVGVGPQPE